MIDVHRIEKMNKANTEEIIKWKYESPYNFYDMTEDSLIEMLEEDYYACFDGRNLIGFFCYGKSAQVPIGHNTGSYKNPNLLDIGLGLHPSLTGKGTGAAFVRAGIDFARSKYHPEGFRLSVAAFNERALSTYEKLGFEVVADFYTTSSKQPTHFYLMELASFS